MDAEGGDVSAQRPTIITSRIPGQSLGPCMMMTLLHSNKLLKEYLDAIFSQDLVLSLMEAL